MLQGKIHIGTSGWNYGGWKGPFYPERISAAELLPCYATHFATVEINNTFYRLPSRKCVENWAAQTPPHFRFAWKASRFITHMKKLKDPEPSIAKLMQAVEPLGDKLGPILFQLPPNWASNPERLEAFLRVLPNGYRYSFELRDTSWLNPRIYELLQRHGCSHCFYDFKGFQAPEIHTTDFVYVRLHGPHESPYQGSYDGRTLSAYARRMLRWAGEGRDVYCYFDNDQKARAPFDAKDLLARIAAQRARTQRPSGSQQLQRVRA